MAKKQLRIPGTEAQKIKELDHAAEAYVMARDERMERTELEVAARDALVSVMTKHKLEVYRDEDHDPPLVITITPGKAKVKVTTAEDGSDDDSSDAGTEE